MLEKCRYFAFDIDHVRNQIVIIKKEISDGLAYCREKGEYEDDRNSTGRRILH